ncbi:MULTISPECIES: TrbC/VirB2 family protein [Snodgrassella]|uniref:TrbC/VirB2 family protein n=1 Tax=Snodgrassella TaxID=1193515 RepID=UPI000816195E|nr:MULTISPECIES: TrbC/VirB2 family protein [Snodgrassella]MCO6521224.1 TrbC/VirB2 family protein [Snodgrassella sp.]SCC04205.1 type IV secretion system protein VirB2 [Snodgrassella sp. R-53583]
MKKSSKVFIALALVMCAQAALAAGGGGLGNAEMFFNNVATLLKSLGLVILTIAIIVAGYKVMWGGSTVREVAPIVLGGVLIGSASYIAGLLV